MSKNDSPIPVDVAPPQIFSPAALTQDVHDTLDQALAAIPPGKDGALIIDGTIIDGRPAPQVLVATRLGTDWSLAAGGAYDGHHVEGKFALQGSWNWHHN